VLKLASLSLVALLALASPAPAAVATSKPCIAPEKFPNAIQITGDDLKSFREIAKRLPEQVDLVLLLKTEAAPVAIAFFKGCAVGYGVLGPVPAEKPTDDGKI